MGLEDINLVEMFELIKTEQEEHDLIQGRIRNKAEILIPHIKEHFDNYVRDEMRDNLPEGVEIIANRIYYLGQKGYVIISNFVVREDADLSAVDPKLFRITRAMGDIYTSIVPWVYYINFNLDIEKREE